MKVHDAMTPAPATCDSMTTLPLVARLLIDHDCAAIPVTECGRLAGVITDRDIARAVAIRGEVAGLPAREVMTRAVITVEPEDSLDKAVELMEANAIHHLPVIRGDGSVVGIVAQSDLGRRMTNREFGRLARQTSIPAKKGSSGGRGALVRKEG